MPRHPALILEEAPEPAEIPLHGTPKNQTREWWNGVLDRRGVEIVCDPTGDFRPGARFQWEDFLGDGREDYRPQVPVLEEWATGTVLRDKRGRVFVVSDARLLVRQEKAPQ